MPTPQLIPDNRRLRKMVLTLEDLTLDLVDAIGLRVDLEWSDGHKAVVLWNSIDGPDVGNLSDEVRDAVDAFLWGESAKAVLTWAQRLDDSRQSRKVREDCRRIH